MRLLDGAVVAVVLAVGVTAWAGFDRPGASSPEAGIATVAACDDDQGWVDQAGTVVDVHSENVLATSVALRSCLAGPGVLSLSLRGSVVDGTGAYAVIALGLDNLWEGFVTDPIDLRLDVPTGGTVLLAFVNDRYEPSEDRNLWVSEIAFAPR